MQYTQRDGSKPSRFCTSWASHTVKNKFLFFLPLFLALFFLGVLLKAEDDVEVFTDEELRKMLFGDNAPEPLEKTKIKWLPSYTLESGIGFSDNPLYGPYLEEEATFWENSLEGFFLIESLPEYFTYLYLYGEGKIYEELPNHQTSSIYLGQFEHAYTPSGSNHTFGFRVRYTHYDQGFDFSDLGLPYSISIQSDKTEIIPYVSKEISANLSATFQILLGREDFQTITDDNEERGISLEIESSSDLFNWKFESEYVEKKYEDRSRRDWDATELAGILETEKVNLALTFEKDLDQGPLKDSRFKLSRISLRDDGGGYYDYEKLSLSLRQELLVSDFKIEFSLGGGQTRYNHRLTDDGEIFKRDSLASGLSINQVIAKNLEAYFRWTREQDFSNARDYEYSSNFWSIGVAWEI